MKLTVDGCTYAFSIENVRKYDSKERFFADMSGLPGKKLDKVLEKVWREAFPEQLTIDNE